MAYYEDDYRYGDWYDRYDRDDRCDRCDRRDRWDCCRCHNHKPEPPKKRSAQFVNTVAQNVNVRTDTLVEFNFAQVHADKGITLQIPNNIILERGRYLVAYYVTIQNNDDDADTFNARLVLDGKDLAYTTSKVRINPRTAPLNIDFIDSLSKTNLVEITKTSTLQLVISVTDPIGTPDAHYQIQDASIVIERLD